jgi:hypothetical protein
MYNSDDNSRSSLRQRLTTSELNNSVSFSAHPSTNGSDYSDNYFTDVLFGPTAGQDPDSQHLSSNSHSDSHSFRYENIKVVDVDVRVHKAERSAHECAALITTTPPPPSV